MSFKISVQRHSHLWSSRLFTKARTSEVAERRLQTLKDINELPIDDEVEHLASKLIENGAIPATAQADAIHIAVAAVQRIDYLVNFIKVHASGEPQLLSFA
jgi:hypothetical protein